MATKTTKLNKETTQIIEAIDELSSLKTQAKNQAAKDVIATGIEELKNRLLDVQRQKITANNKKNGK